MERGRYIAFEGTEGAGKSTHARRLAFELDAVLTREHGGTPIGLLIRSILADPEHTELTDKAEALLIAADRAQHIDEVVRPALETGRHVVSDRSIYSSLAYQGYGRELPLDDVRRVNEWAIGGCWPDLVVLLDVPPEQLARRMRRRELDRFERSGREFYERVADGFRQLAAGEPERWVVVDGGRPMEAVAAIVRQAVRDRLGL
jgi:dTMP kinase